MRRLLDRHLGDGLARAGQRPGDVGAGRHDPQRGALGRALRGARRARRVRARARACTSACCAASSIDVRPRRPSRFDPDALTVGFARRLATYKRLHLLVLDPDPIERSRGDQRVQLLLAGKAHPSTSPPSGSLQTLFGSSGDRSDPGACRSSRTTTSRSPRRSSPAATCGSTCPAPRSRRAGRAG